MAASPFVPAFVAAFVPGGNEGARARAGREEDEDRAPQQWQPAELAKSPLYRERMQSPWSPTRLEQPSAAAPENELWDQDGAARTIQLAYLRHSLSR